MIQFKHSQRILAIYELYEQWRKLKEPTVQRYIPNKGEMSKEWKDYYDSRSHFEYAGKILLKDAIGYFIEDNDLTANIRLEGFRFDEDGIEWPHMISIYNSVGGIKKTNWLNKISIALPYYDKKSWHVLTHKVRTDPKFLSPLDTKFLEFITELMEFARHPEWKQD